MQKSKKPKGLNIKDDRKTAKGYGEEKSLQQIESIERMLKAMNLDPKTPLDIWIGGTLPGFSGLRRFSSKQRRHRTSHQRRTQPQLN